MMHFDPWLLVVGRDGEFTYWGVWIILQPEYAFSALYAHTRRRLHSWLDASELQPYVIVIVAVIVVVVVIASQIRDAERSSSTTTTTATTPQTQTMPTDDTAPRIRPLPAPAAARLRSSLAVTSLADAVSELMQNSLDAGARTVAVQANVARNSCVVEDDGAGILPADVPMVGVMHATSKYNNNAAPAAAPATRTFGSRGLALSALSTHSLFTLTTRHASSATTYTTRISYSTPLTAAGPSPPHLRLPRPGTTVRIDALHADLPVRFHARLAAATANPDAEWSTITHRAAHLLLLAPAAVSFTARDEHGARRIAVRAPPPSTAPTGRTASWRMAVLRQVYGRAAVGADWERVRAGTATTTIRGHISAAKGHGTRGLQFLAVNGHPLAGAASALHAEANRVFAASAFGCEDGEGRRKGVERWPMFVLEVECAAGAEALGGEGGTEGKGGLEGAWLAGAVELLGRLVEEFLRAHGFSAAPAAAAAEGVKRPIEGGVRGGAGARAGTPLRTITNGSSAVNHGDTRALALWSRVKAAKHDAREEDGRKGCGGLSAGMATARRSSTTEQTETDTRGIATTSSSSSPDDSSKENEDGSAGAGAGDSHGLWRDPRSKHVFRVNARTGNNSPATATAARKRALSLASSAASRTAKKPRIEEEEEEARGPFVDALLKSWTNPVFARTEAPIPSTTQHTHHHCGPSPSSSSSPFTTPHPPTALGKLTKPGLATATVLAQLDHKYILLKMRGLSTTPTSSQPPTMLVLLDQHAASERVRTEALLSSLTAAPPQRLAAPLHYALADAADAALVRRYEGVLRAWGVHCAVVPPPPGQGKGQVLAVTALPAAVADRCVAEPALALAMVRRHVYALADGGKKCGSAGAGGDGDWVKGLAGCPVGLVEMVNSRACRGAVMFGDALGMGECVSLVRALAGCRFPFMCAHGRPSMVPLVDLGVGAVEERGGGGGGGFKRDFGEWMERRKGGGE